jgi:hypothetical protein
MQSVPSSLAALAANIPVLHPLEVMLGTGHNPIKHEDCNTLDNYMSDRRRL